LRIKICGITSTADAIHAVEQGADAIGLNFFAHSKRCVEEPTALAILGALPPFVEPVGIFVNVAIAHAAERAGHFSGLRTLQIHADDPEIGAAPAYGLIQAFQVADHGDLRRIEDHLHRSHTMGALPNAIIVDSRVPGEYGGTGVPAPWQLLAEFRPRVPLILAGGLTAENVAEAIRIVRPYAVDVASGVELAPGRKDEDKMKRFIGNAREVAARYGI
jgi:phosphoribosylanthranilate isomerase